MPTARSWRTVHPKGDKEPSPLGQQDREWGLDAVMGKREWAGSRHRRGRIRLGRAVADTSDAGIGEIGAMPAFSGRQLRSGAPGPSVHKAENQSIV